MAKKKQATPFRKRNTREEEVRRISQHLNDADNFHMEFLNEHKIALLEVIDHLKNGRFKKSLSTAQQLYKYMEWLEDALSKRMAEHEGISGDPHPI